MLVCTDLTGFSKLVDGHINSCIVGIPIDYFTGFYTANLRMDVENQFVLSSSGIWLQTIPKVELITLIMVDYGDMRLQFED